MKRIIKNFIELTQILSPYRKEKDVSDYIIKKLKPYASKIIIDSSSKYTGSNTGNLIIKIKGTHPRKTLLLSAHMDTINTEIKPKIEIKKNIIKTRNNTILGADCKAGISIILETVYEIFEKKLDFPNLELVFTTCEEYGLLGSKFIEKKYITSTYGLVYDNEKDFNSVVIKAPTADMFEINVKGKASHSGVAPEKGLSAIKVLSYIINRLKTGRITPHTTVNIGFIEGGNGINIIPEKAKCMGEIRTYKIKEMEKVKQNINKILNLSRLKFYIKNENSLIHPSVTFKSENKFPELSISENSKIIKLIRQTMKEMKINPLFIKSGGATDANNFFKYGIITPNIATGMKNVHTDREYLKIDEFIKSKDFTVRFIKNYVNK